MGDDQLLKTKYWIPLTYSPKIPGVLNGTIRQTIRTRRTYAVEDRIAFHGWAGKPYRSPWSFRTEYFRLREVIPIFILPAGIAFEDDRSWKRWENLAFIAEKDGIVPATGEELGRVLSSYHKIPVDGVPAQILRW